MKPNIACVIVTFNRLETLKKALSCYEGQTRFPNYVIVVDNHSNDGTSEYLDEWEKEKHLFQCFIIHLSQNVGGSGGFYIGCKKALNLNVDYVWLADDDAYPETDVLEKFQTHLQNDLRARKAAALCTIVVEHGKIQADHRRRYRLTWNNMIAKSVPLDEYRNEVFPLQLFSYVGVIIKSEVLRKVGLCEKDFFIYNDDAEHALRVSECGELLCYTDMKVLHAKPIIKKRDHEKESIDWRYYYSARNSYMLLKRHFKKQYLIHWYLDYIKTKMHLLFNYKTDKYKIRLAALLDAKYNRLGMHKIYKPGWRI